MRLGIVCGLLAMSVAGCGSSNNNSPATGGVGDMATAAAPGADLAGTPGMMPSGVTLPSKFGTYIELGDSISDRGGVGPFFYDLLYQNDDTTYPQWAGLDLKTKFGVQMHVHGAVAGAQTKDMPGQVTGLPASLPGPVLITVTIGGNDLQAAALQAIQNNDMTYRENMRKNIDSFMTTLTTPGRFGSDVAVYVLLANIYDPTDGTGDFSKCPAPLSFYPKTPSDAIFGRWNQVAIDEFPKFSNSIIEPMHDDFHGHGVVSTDNWFNTDCIHPVKAGHQAIRKMFWKALTGTDGPA